ncbi:unnamed protein product, partial [Notodromas monacha]
MDSEKLEKMRISHSGLVARSPEGHAAKGMQIKGNEDLWVEIQAHTFRNWVNEQIKPTGLVVQDLETDFCDGLKLIALLEVLQKKSIRKIANPINQHQFLENVQFALNSIENDGIKLVNIGNEDIVNGNLKLILGLIWSLILRYQIGRSKFPPKKLMLAWLQAVIPECRPTNFTSDWNSGISLSALLDYCKPGLFPNWRDLDPNDGIRNCKRAMELAQREFDIPMVLEPEYLASPYLDELSGMTYLSYFMKENSPGYTATLDWTKSQLPQLPIDNFTTDWNDGAAVCALVRTFGGPIPEYDKIYKSEAYWESNLKKGFEGGEKINIQPLLKPKEMADPHVNHLGPMAYVARFQWLTPRNTPGERIKVTSSVRTVKIHNQVPFNIDFLDDDVEPANLRAEIHCPNDRVIPIKLEMTPNGARGVFVPEEIGMHRVVVTNEGELGSGCPCVVRATPETVKYTLGGIDPCAIGSIVEVLVSPNGVYMGTFQPDQAGEWKIAVTYEGEHIEGSPFTCYVYDPNAIRVTDLDGACPCLDFTFTVDSRDCGYGETLVDVAYSGKSVPHRVIPIEEGLTKVTFRPPARGKCRVYVYFNGIEPKASPFTIRVGSHDHDSKKIHEMEKRSQRRAARAAAAAAAAATSTSSSVGNVNSLPRMSSSKEPRSNFNSLRKVVHETQLDMRRGSDSTLDSQSAPLTNHRSPNGSFSPLPGSPSRESKVSEHLVSGSVLNTSDEMGDRHWSQGRTSSSVLYQGLGMRRSSGASGSVLNTSDEMGDRHWSQGRTSSSVLYQGLGMRRSSGASEERERSSTPVGSSNKTPTSKLFGTSWSPAPTGTSSQEFLSTTNMTSSLGVTGRRASREKLGTPFSYLDPSSLLGDTTSEQDAARRGSSDREKLNQSWGSSNGFGHESSTLFNKTSSPAEKRFESSNTYRSMNYTEMSSGGEEKLYSSLSRSQNSPSRISDETVQTINDLVDAGPASTFKLVPVHKQSGFVISANDASQSDIKSSTLFNKTSSPAEKRFESSNTYRSMNYTEMSSGGEEKLYSSLSRSQNSPSRISDETVQTINDLVDAGPASTFKLVPVHKQSGFVISANDASQSDIKVIIKDETHGCQLLHRITDNLDGTFTIHFTPAEAADIKIDVSVKNKKVKESSTLFNKTSSPAEKRFESSNTYRSMNYTEMSSGGEEKLYSSLSRSQNSPSRISDETVQTINDLVDAGPASTFKLVPVHKQSGFVISANDASQSDIKVIIKDETHGCQLLHRITDNLDGTFTIHFTPAEAADIKIDVSVKNKKVKGCPIQMYSYDASQIRVGVIPDGSVGKPVEFSIDGASAGAGNLEILVNGGHVTSNIEDLGDQQFKASFIPHQAIPHTVDMKFNNQPVPGGPWHINVDEGGGLHRKGVSTLTRTTVVSSGNTGSARRGSLIPVTPRVLNADDTQHVSVGQVASFDILAPGCNSREQLTVSVLGPTKQPVSSRLISLDPTSDSSPNFRVEFTVVDVGSYYTKIAVKSDSGDIFEAVGSPFLLRAFDASLIQMLDAPIAGSVGNKWSPFYCQVTEGDKVKIDLQHLEAIPTDEPASFLIKVDGTAPAELSVSVRSPSQTTLPVKVNGTTRTGFHAEFLPKEVGTHTVLVEYNGAAVPGTPF